MPQLLEILESDIHRLTDPALHELGRRLVEVELRANSLPSMGIQTSAKTNLKDGGIDLWVEWPVGELAFTNFIPSNPAGFQFKAGDETPGELAKSLVRHGEFAQSVRRLAERSGTYVLVCSHRLTPIMVESRRTLIERLARQYCGVDLRVVVIGAERLAAWCNSSLGTALESARALRVQIDASIQAPDEVLRRSNLSNQFIETDRVRTQIAAIRELFDSPGAVLRLDGPSGVGKTRTALEATRRNGPLFANCIFVDLSTPGAEGALSTGVINWIRESRSGLIIADECSYESHLRLSALVGGTRLSIITIDHAIKGDPRTGGYLYFPPGDSDLTRPILAARFSGSDLDKAIELSGGWPRMAVLILQAGIEGDLTQVTPREVVQRILWPRSTPDLQEQGALQGLQCSRKFSIRVAWRRNPDSSEGFSALASPPIVSMRLSMYSQNGVS